MDCDRNTTGATAICVSIANPAALCTGGDCICCPVSTADRAMYPHCVPRTNDVQASDATDVPTDRGADTSTDAPADVADSATDVPVDTAPRQLGQMCSAATQCVTGFCAQGVCCNSACMCPGCSCNSAPDFAGLCMRVMSGGDGGSDGGVDASGD